MDLVKRCGPFAEFLVTIGTGTNFFGAEQQYLDLLPVELDILMDLMHKYNIPKPSGKPSFRWYNGYKLEEDGHESCDDDTESHRAGGEVHCTVADAVDIASFREYVDAKTDKRQTQLEGYLRLLQNHGRVEVIEARSIHFLMR